MKVNILILGSVMVWMIVEMVLMQVNILILGSVMVWMIVEMDLMKVRTANSVLRESGNVLLYFEESSKQAVKKNSRISHWQSIIIALGMQHLSIFLFASDYDCKIRLLLRWI